MIHIKTSNVLAYKFYRIQLVPDFNRIRVVIIEKFECFPRKALVRVPLQQFAYSVIVPDLRPVDLLLKIIKFNI